MRLHELSITAFGPFVETVHVDFDDLASGGLFLLTGDTGSGKTSVLDAVCFALYGEVPGDRHVARHLRSDHADPQAAPRVVLRLSVGQRTFRFTRSPAWDRPKQRGHGTTRVQAHVLVEELSGPGWATLTYRLDEAGHLVTALLGMSCTQFTQVAMLPQGRFQAFLRATSTERHAVLQRLFRTRRFEEVERWLVDRRIDLRRRSQAGHDRCAGVLNRLQEAAGTGVPDDWDLLALEPVVADGSVPAWSAEVTECVQRDHARAARELETAVECLQQSRTAFEEAVRVREARSRGERAREALRRLEVTAALEQELSGSLEQHGRAAPVAPLALEAEHRLAAAQAAESAAAMHLGRVTALLTDLPPDSGVEAPSIKAAALAASEARAVATSWLPREQELEDERARVAALAADVVRLTAAIAAGERRQEQDEVARGRLVDSLESSRQAADRRVADVRVADAARASLEAARQSEELARRLGERRTLLATSTTHAQDLRERYLQLREERISGMAAELASGLVVGCSCPVCGSEQHPAPASAAGRVSRVDEDAARTRHETADFERQALQESVAALDAQLQGARSRSEDQPVEHWELAHDRATAALERSVAAQGEVALLEDQLARLDVTGRESAGALATSRARLGERLRQQSQGQRRTAQLEAELEALLAEHRGADTVAQLVELLTTRASDLERAHDALLSRTQARAEASRATRLAADAAIKAGFDDVAAALAATLSVEERHRRAGELETRRATRAAAEAALSDEVVAAALAVPAPDVSEARAALDQAEATRDAAHAAQLQSDRRRRRVQTLAVELRAALGAWEPLRHDHALVASLTALVEGKSADNRLRMRLSAYVLSERLRQVVAAANERLGAITDQRYTLEQADEKGAGEQRGGLSLRVRDEWSGKQRDPATLSGGETFLVSLALALGLADTVSHEAGGTQLDTLFIDEGFGALDATTLDSVMDTLDALRDGGRVVGLVSHVAELRSRVPSQLEVHKARRGSTLRTLVARD